MIGRGEAAPSRRYDEFTDDIIEILDQGIEIPNQIDDPKKFSKNIVFCFFEIPGKYKWFKK